MLMSGPATIDPDARPRRRTQAQRRAATREALLDATIASLVAEGYAHTTIRGIAQRAGVTPGAAQHHFASKAELVSQALRHLMATVEQQLFATEPPREGTTLERIERMLDRVWEIHTGPSFLATLELWVAARTDPELGEQLSLVQAEQTERNVAAFVEAYPDIVTHPDFFPQVVTQLAAMRGLALLALVSGDDPQRWWPTTRAHMLRLAAELIEEREAAQ